MPALRYWLPPALWAALILLASSDLFSAAHTGIALQDVIAAIFGRPMRVDWFNVLHFLLRKAAHLTEYAILGALLFRAVRADRSGWTVRWAIIAIAIAFGVASIDEWHQSFIPSRTSSPIDVLIDTVGAMIGASRVLFSSL